MLHSWQETPERLHSAETVADLWAVLIEWHGIRSTAQWDEPYALFRRFHEHDRSDAVVTAALVCTDYRWRRAARRLVANLTGSGILDDADLDQLAEWFLEEKLVVVIEGGPADEDEVAVARSVWPPLRRWAASHTVARTPERWRALIDLARSFPSADGVAIAAGVMDAAGHVPTHDAESAVAIGVGWGSGVIRLAALDAFADVHGLDAACAVAARDPSAKVRAWADDHRTDTSPRSAESSTSDRAAREPFVTDQATLF